jgi:hypothetical protein
MFSFNRSSQPKQQQQQQPKKEPPEESPFSFGASPPQRDHESSTSSAASSLHDLFGGGGADKSALTLSAARPPARPKPAPTPAEEPSPAASGGSTTLFAQLVQVFRDVGGAWQPVGQSGLALVGGPAASAYQLVLYDASNKKPFSLTDAAALAPTPQRPQYLSVVDGQGHSWSLFFAQPEQAHHFLQHVRPAKRGSNRVRHRS